MFLVINSLNLRAGDFWWLYVIFGVLLSGKWIPEID